MIQTNTNTNLTLRNLTKASVALLTFSGGMMSMATTPAHAAPKMGAMMMTKLTGTFKQVTHATKGRATAAGRTLTLSAFETGMGPQLHVYLVPSKLAASNASVKSAVAAKKFVDLGALKSIKGTQSYKIPTSAKTKGQTVVIWCDKFDVVFGSATLA